MIDFKICLFQATSIAALLTSHALSVRAFSVPLRNRDIVFPLSGVPGKPLYLSNDAHSDDTPDGFSEATGGNEPLKEELLERIGELGKLKDRDGGFSIDFGVKGGELDKKSRAPQKVNFYSISRDVGEAADAVMAVAQELSNNKLIDEPTLHLGDVNTGDLAPLNGEWKLLFSTAADATFSKDSKRGSASVKNVVNAKRGRITNVIEFANVNGTEPVLKQLNVVIGAKPVGKSRVELNFRYAKLVLTKFFIWRIRWALYIPVPAPFITRVIVFFSRIFRFGAKGKKLPPKAFFDVLYLDKDLRIHQTGEDNLFIQAKESWKSAQPFLSS